MKKKSDNTEQPTEEQPAPRKEKKGKPDKKRKQPKAQAQKSKRSGIGAFATSGLVASAIVVIAICLALAWLQFGRHQELSEKNLANSMAHSQASLLQLALEYGQRQLDMLATSPVVRTAFENEDTPAAERTLSSLIPGASIHLVPASGLLPGQELTFTARDMARQAMETDSPQPVLVPGDPAKLVAAKAVSGAAGVVVMEWRLGLLEQQMSRQDLQNATLRVSQQGGQTLLERGRGSGGPEAQVSAPYGTEVQIKLPASGQDSALLGLFVIITGGGLLLILLLQAFVFRSIAQAIRKDGALLANLSQELTSNPTASPRGDFSFQPLALVVGNLQKLAKKASASATARQASRTPPPEDAFNDMPLSDGDMMVEETDQAPGQGASVPAGIFRAYDIRGRVGDTLDEETMTLIGRAVGSEAAESGQETLVVARDGRTSSPALCKALIKGLVESGRKVIDVGAVPTPLMHFAAEALGTRSGVCVTGSHNPPQDNGVKILLAGKLLHGDDIIALYERITRGRFTAGEGSVQESDIVQRYINAVVDDVVLARPLKVVIDCGNGIAGPVAGELFTNLGCDVTMLYGEVDGNFPNHHPDPGQPENLKDLISKVSETGAELGIAFDGDGDRIGVVTPRGEIIWPDRLMMLYARDLLSRSPGADILFDVKCSRELSRQISQQGGRPLMWKTGRSVLHAKMQEVGAPLAGEMSGHIFFADRWNGFDDALYAAARLLEILSLESDDADGIFAGLKTGITTPEMKIESDDEQKFELVRKLADMADEFGGSPSTLDGLRIDFEDGWGLIRASNTGPALTSRFEGRDEQALKRIQTLFHDKLQAVDSSLKLPF
jgi:phosphomannomutase/phosphoglucomutase